MPYLKCKQCGKKFQYFIAHNDNSTRKLFCDICLEKRNRNRARKKYNIERCGDE